MARRVEIVTVCEHGKCDPHRWDPSTSISDEGWCPGGSRRVLEPGELIPNVFARLENWPDGSLWRTVDVRVSDLLAALEKDALAEGEQ